MGFELNATFYIYINAPNVPTWLLLLRERPKAIPSVDSESKRKHGSHLPGSSSTKKFWSWHRIDLFPLQNNPSLHISRHQYGPAWASPVLIETSGQGFDL